MDSLFIVPEPCETGSQVFLGYSLAQPETGLYQSVKNINSSDSMLRSSANDTARNVQIRPISWNSNLTANKKTRI